MAETTQPLLSSENDQFVDFKDDEKDKSFSISGENDSLLSDDDRVEPPKNPPSFHSAADDWWNMAYLILYLQGVGSLLPWNFFITARGYFNSKFQEEPSIQDSFENSFSVAAMIPNVLSLLMNVFLTNRMNRNVRMITCMFIMLISFVLTVVFVKIDTSSWTSNFFAVTIIIVVFINIASSVYSGTFFGMAGIIGQKYTQALMGGQGLGGTFAAVASILSLIGDSSPEESAFGYFLTAVLVIAACCFTYFVFFRLQFVNYCLARNQLKALRGSQASIISAKPSINALTESSGSIVGIKMPTPRNEKIPYLKILKDLSPMALSVCFTFFITLALFPSIISNIESVNKDNGTKWTNELFAPLMCFLLFNLGDLAGRTAAGSLQLFSAKSKLLPILCLARVAFVPLFALCNYKPNERHAPVFFNSDVYPIAFMVLFGTSNGYLGSLCMMYGPKLVEGQYAENAGTFMALFLSCGLATGAGFSFVLNALI